MSRRQFACEGIGLGPDAHVLIESGGSALRVRIPVGNHVPEILLLYAVILSPKLRVLRLERPPDVCLMAAAALLQPPLRKHRYSTHTTSDTGRHAHGHLA